jgi:hypothetical protein
MIGVKPADAERFFYHYDAQAWTTGGRHPRPIARWQSKLKGWQASESNFAASTNGRHHAPPRTGAVPDLLPPI